MRDSNLLDGKAVRDRILSELAVYVRGQANAARTVGITFDEQTWPSDLTQEECKTRLVACDVVLVAVGIPRFLRADMVKPGAAVIDIGINQVIDNDGESRIVGDVDTDNVKEVASWLTPVPGGVGPVTVAMFMRNAVEAHRKQLAAGWLDPE